MSLILLRILEMTFRGYSLLRYYDRGQIYPHPQLGTYCTRNIISGIYNTQTIIVCPLGSRGIFYPLRLYPYVCWYYSVRR